MASSGKARVTGRVSKLTSGVWHDRAGGFPSAGYGAGAATRVVRPGFEPVDPFFGAPRSR